MALRLTVPAGLAAADTAVETRPRQLNEWLDSLPLTQLFDSTRAVCNGLAALNRSRLPADERLKLLDIYTPTLRRLRGEIAEDYNKAALPLPPTSRQAVNLARELLIEEAYAYKLALLEKTGKLILFGARKQLAPLIVKVLRTLSDALTLSYQSYLPTPAGVWHEMHELYRYAAQHKLLDEDNGALKEPSIDGVYKQAVLIALTDPYRLPRVELPEVMRITEHLAPLTELRFGPLIGAQQLFVIHSDTDKPPRAMLQAGTETEPRGSEWVVGTVLLVHRLSEIVREREAEEAHEREAGMVREPAAGRQPAANADVLYSAPLELLQRLILCWGAPPKRLFRRQVGQAMVQVCTGIERICRLAGSAAARERVAQPAGPASSSNPATPSSPASSSNPAAPSSPASSSNPATQAGAAVQAGAAIQEWEVINQSAGGFKLRGVHAEEAINVGEVIAVQYHGMPGLSVGAIRWVQALDDNSVEFGMQMLAPRAESVSIEPTIGNRGAQRALLLPEIAVLQQPASLLTQPGNYQPGREFLLARSTDLRTVRAAELIDKTVCYELFRFVAE